MTEDPLQRPVSGKPFADMSAVEVRARATELSDATGWGPTARVGPVAKAWSELASLMEAAGAATVADVGDEAAAMAERLWVVPPGGSLL